LSLVRGEAVRKTLTVKEKPPCAWDVYPIDGGLGVADLQLLGGYPFPKNLHDFSYPCKITWVLSTILLLRKKKPAFP
jgi:hypothetical protein